MLPSLPLLLQALAGNTSCLSWSKQWADILQQQPATVFAATDIVARKAAAVADGGGVINPWLLGMVGCLMTAAKDNEEVAKAVAAAGVHTAASSTTRRCRWKANDGNSAASMISFSATSVKFISKSIERREDNMQALEFATQILTIVQGFVAAVAAANDSKASADATAAATSAAAASDVMTWLHVSAHALYCCAKALLWPHCTGRAAEDAQAWQQETQTTQDSWLSGADNDDLGLGDLGSLDSCDRTCPHFGQKYDTRICSHLSEILRCWSLFLKFACEQLALLAGNKSSDGEVTAGSGPAVSAKALQKLQQQSQRLEDRLTAAIQQWEGAAYKQMMQQLAATDIAGSSCMLFVGARRVVGFSLADQLQQYAADLCAVLPTTLCCNNPSCMNLGGMSELSCVGRRKCSRCQAAGYCSKECQTQHWSKHKRVCSRLVTSNS